jgi:uncharacterized metal-binding protein
VPKRFLTVVLLLAVSVLSFSFSQEEVLDRFKSYMNDYQREVPELQKIKKLEEDLNYLSVYRLYKLQMVGSIEKKESATTIADLLSRHLESLPVEDFSSNDDRIAYSAFLAWVLSDFSGKAFQVGTLNEMPAYLSTFNSFTSQVRGMAEAVYKEWMAYALGLVKDEPSAFPGELKKTDAFAQYSLKADADEKSEREILSLSNNQIYNLLNSSIDTIGKREYNVSSLVEEEVKRFAVQAALDVASLMDSNLMNATRDLFQLWLYRSIGLAEEVPHYPTEISMKTLSVKGLNLSIPLNNPDYERVVEILNENPDSRLKSIEKLQMASQVLSMRQFTPVGLIEKDISDEVKKIIPIQAGILGQIRNSLSREIVSVSEKGMNLWWLRFVGYITLALIAFFILPALKKYWLGIVITFEIFYMLFLTDVTRNLFDLSLYSIIGLPVFAFILIMAVFSIFKKGVKKPLLLAKLLLLAMIAIFPFLELYNDVSEISMDSFEGFYDSIYYPTLKRDLFLAPESLISLEIRDLSSVVSSELNSFKRVLRVIVPNELNAFSNNAGLSYTIDNNGRLRVNAPAFSEYMSIENQRAYSDELRGLSKDLSNFIRDSERNAKNFASLLKSFVSSSERIIRYSGETLRADFNEFVETSLKSKPELNVVMDDYLAEVSDYLENAALPAIVRVFRVPKFVALALGLFLLSVIIFLIKKPLISLINIVVISVYFIISLVEMNELTLFVQGGSPILNITVDPSINALFLIVFAGIIVLSVLWVLLSQKKGSVSE